MTQLQILTYFQRLIKHRSEVLPSDCVFNYLHPPRLCSATRQTSCERLQRRSYPICRALVHRRLHNFRLPPDPCQHTWLSNGRFTLTFARLNHESAANCATFDAGERISRRELFLRAQLVANDTREKDTCVPYSSRCRLEKLHNLTWSTMRITYRSV
jgi:hypothetical protein